MAVRDGQHWVCSNPACRSEAFIIAARRMETTQPKCSCGSSMKKAYTPPNIRLIVHPDERKACEEKILSRVR